MAEGHRANERGPMVDDDLSKMKKSKMKLIDGIANPQPLISCLDGKGVLTRRHRETIDAENCDVDKVQRLINLLMDDCRGGFISFVETLQETGHNSLAKLLLDDRTMRIMLIGEIGAGKSALGNNLLGLSGNNGFISQVSASSVTTENRSLTNVINLRGKDISFKLLDTPGLSDVRKSNSEINEELVKCIFKLYPGPHIFCFVLKVDRITSSIMTTIENYKDMFGECLNKYGVIVFTNKDRLKDVSFDEYIKKAPDEFRLFLDEYCGRRYALINNDNPQNGVTDIQELILKTIKENEFQYYTHDMFEKATELYRQKMLQLEEERNKMKNENQELKKKLEDYEDMKKKLEESEDQKRAKEKELEDMKVKLKRYQEQEDLSLSHEQNVPKEDKMMSDSPKTTEPVDLQTQENVEDLKRTADIKSVDIGSLCDILVNRGYLNDKERKDIVTIKPSIATVDHLVDILQHNTKKYRKAYRILIKHLKMEATQSSIIQRDKRYENIGLLNKMEAYKENYPARYATLHSNDQSGIIHVTLLVSVLFFVIILLLVMTRLEPIMRQSCKLDCFDTKSASRDNICYGNFLVCDARNCG
ncbi:uncharacterized protein LOC126814287 [Patella vulgata]|uniref:uncharacterized protein LOC126814287 n=1 Tax=Patella vulgata TaxID=6465 RepID=UPI0021801E8F|nr:uncharacterized protein LOC126814287 [Patella vulgata]